MLSCTDVRRRQMEQVIIEADSMNRNYMPMTSDSLLTIACDFYDSHGSPNERMKAHYLLGRTYADLGEAPHALDEYHTASDCADTTAQDCDFSLLARIHGQCANLFIEQLMPHEALEELNYAYFDAQRANDTLVSICALEWMGLPYDILEEHDSVKLVLTSAYKAYKRHGFEGMALNCLPALIDVFIIEGDYVQAKKYMDIYEQSLSNDIEDGRELYFYYKGNYYSGISQLDSAEYYYRKCLYQASSQANTEAAYKGLYELFKRNSLPDSVAKYADSCYVASNLHYKESTTAELYHKHSLYNYNKNKLIAERMTKKASENKYKYLLSIVFSFFLVIFFCVLLFIQWKRKKEELQRTKANYIAVINKQERAKQELDQLQRHKYDNLLQQKQKEIDECQCIIDSLRITIDPKSVLSLQLTCTDIYKRFEFLSVNYNRKPYADDWKKLQEMMDSVIPNFRITLYSMGWLDEKDYNLCILLRLHFTLHQIGILLSETPQYLSKRRKYLLLKLYHQDGKPETFDKYVKSIS